MTRPETYLCTDPSRAVQVLKRRDMEGNIAGGFVIQEGGRCEPAFFRQATGRRFAEEMAAVFGGRVTWGLGEQ